MHSAVAKRVVDVHIEAVTTHINCLSCPRAQTLTLVNNLKIAFIEHLVDDKYVAIEEKLKSSCKTLTFSCKLSIIIMKLRRGDDYMATSTNISIRMDAETKAKADALFGELGMNLTTAFNIFVRQSLREGKIPFEISLNQPNAETKAAMMEAERIATDKSVKGYTDMNAMFADLAR